METKVHLSKLNNTNFFNWKFKLELLLIKEKVWHTISKETPTGLALTEKWSEQDETARALIGLNVEDTQLIYIRNAKSAKEAWKNLKEIHENDSVTCIVTLFRQLYSTRMEEGQDLQNHIDHLSSLFMKITDMGEVFSETMKIGIILSSLPKSWNNLVTTLSTTRKKKEDLTLSIVLSNLFDEEIRRKINPYENGESLMKVSTNKKFTRGHSNPDQSTSSNFKKVIFCHFCKKRNHSMQDCYKLKAYNEKNKANMIEDDESEEFILSICENDIFKESDTEECMLAVGDQNDKTLLGIRSSKSDWSIFPSEWTLDSGATSHITNERQLLSHFISLDNKYVQVANGFKLKVHGNGTVKIQLKNQKGKTFNAKFTNVLYVPDLRGNFISIRKITQRGFEVRFYEEKADISFNKTILTTATIKNELFKFSNQVCEVKEIKNKKACIHHFHRIFGHRNMESIKRMINEKVVTGIELIPCKDCELQCKVCIESKMTRKSFTKNNQISTKKIFDLVHTDVCGPMQTLTQSNKKYMLTFIDDFSRYTKVYLLNNKAEVKNKLMDFVNLVKNQFDTKPKKFNSDRGGEYLNHELQAYFNSEGIEFKFTSPYTPQLNGIAERKNRSLIEMVRCMINDANLPKSFWGEAVMRANYLQNRMITSATNKTPYEFLYKKRPQVKDIEIFGSKCYVKIPNEKRRKLEQSSKEMIFLGNDINNSNIYRCYDKENNKIVISRDVTFENSLESNHYETEFIFKNKNENGSESIHKKHVSFDPEPSPESHSQSQNNSEAFSETGGEQSTQNTESDSDHQSTTQNPDSESEHSSTPPIQRISTRINKGNPPNRYGYDQNLQINSNSDDIINMLLLCSITEPKNISDVENSEHKIEWTKAMKEEMDSLDKNETWVICELPKGRKAIGCKWLYKVKTDLNGEVDRFKARLVVQGFSQKFGIDYDEVFAPVVKQSTLRILLSIASFKKLKVYQFDVKTAFLNGILNEEIYMKQPPGFEIKGKENHVCLLKRSLYGLKQAPKSWNDAIDETLITFGFQRCLSDNCLYFKRFSDGNWCILLIYVDDILITATSEEISKEVERQISSIFEIRSLGEVNHYLGMEVKRENDIYTINQNQFIKKIIKEFGLTDAKESKIPLDSGYEKNQQGQPLLPTNKDYQKLVGSLLYISLNTRPDIAASVAILAQKVSKPSMYDWNELKRVLRYLKGSNNLKLYLSSNEEQDLTGYADANWGENRDDGKSNSGYLFKLNGGTISWCSRKQKCVALSSTEAELIALTEAVKESIWLKKLLKEIDFKIQDKIVIFEDNESTRKIIMTDKQSNRTKHISVRYHFIRDLVKKNEISIDYCPSDDMIADTLTKPLSRVKFQKFRDLLGIRN